MCSVENCTRTCYKAAPCCWNHRGHVSKFTAVVKPVVESVPQAVVKPVVGPVVEPDAELVVEPVVESVLEALAEPVVETVVEAVVKPVTISQQWIAFTSRRNQTRECNQVIKPFNSTFNTPFLLDTAADMAYTDHDLTNDLKIKSVDKPQDIFAEPSNEFIDKALQKISKIPDYVPLNFDVYGRAPKGNFIY
ncbi:unnamed protein product [Phytophthora lilii]|uniref:Unnamed protein product n=1 Tax=Phytophthora lilii TaxID=2077276 RepID=A0A9W7CSJ4_9STRA|nr:unnamed protein product [Phytophthora lilii]